MKAEQLRDMSEDELVRKKAELKDQLFKLRFQHELGQLETTGKLQAVRRDIARVETLLAEIRRTAK
ncbi:MAG: 50S ribosomal protein L29 [Candidatus Aminicenantes bacterium]|jgi:large subunit ribosomal protein L29|nr:50S ribosomal protein L29 [Candidatus Aminicenantes bacterium]